MRGSVQPEMGLQDIKIGLDSQTWVSDVDIMGLCSLRWICSLDE